MKMLELEELRKVAKDLHLSTDFEVDSGDRLDTSSRNTSISTTKMLAEITSDDLSSTWDDDPLSKTWESTYFGSGHTHPNRATRA